MQKVRNDASNCIGISCAAFCSCHEQHHCGAIWSFAVLPFLPERRTNRQDGSCCIARTMQKDHRLPTQSNTLSTTFLSEQMQSVMVSQVCRPNQMVTETITSVLSASITPCSRIICARTAGSGGAPMEKLSDDVQTAHQGRFVRITIEQLGTIYGASLWEVRVFGLHV